MKENQINRKTDESVKNHFRVGSLKQSFGINHEK